MQGTLSFQDVIKKSVLEAGSFVQGVTWEAIVRALIYIGLSLIVGFLIYFIYRKNYRGVVFSHTFAVSLIGMTILTCAIVVTIMFNVALSLGMVGALSIVRYRSAVKDPMDLMFLFWAVAAGIATGAGYFFIAIIVTVIVWIMLLLTGLKHSRDDVYIMLIHYVGEGIDADVRRILGTLRYQIRSKTMRKRDVEMAIEVRVKSHSLVFVDQIREIENVNDVSLVQYSGDYIE